MATKKEIHDKILELKDLSLKMKATLEWLHDNDEEDRIAGEKDLFTLSEISASGKTLELGIGDKSVKNIINERLSKNIDGTFIALYIK